MEMENIAIVEMICDILDDRVGPLNGGPRRRLISFVKDRPGHDRRYAVDATKIQKNLGWTPRESFLTGLGKTIQWYLDHPRWVERIQTGEYQSWIKEQYET